MAIVELAPGHTAVGLVSPGTTNRVQVRLQTGRYLLVSLTGGVIFAATTVR